MNCDTSDLQYLDSKLFSYLQHKISNSGLAQNERIQNKMELAKNMLTVLISSEFKTASNGSLSTLRKEFVSKVDHIVKQMNVQQVSDDVVTFTETDLLEYLYKLLKNYEDYQSKSRSVFKTIISHHNQVRDDLPVRTSSVTPATSLNRFDLCEQLVPASISSSSLQAYADSASFMGNKEWVKQSNAWFLQYSSDYFFGEEFPRVKLKHCKQVFHI